MKKTVIIIISILLVVGILLILFFNLNSKESVPKLTPEEKKEFVKNLIIENENVLTSSNRVTVQANIQNNNPKAVKVKSVHAILTDESGKTLKEVDIKVNKIIKSGSKTKFSKTVLLNNNQRTFTKYEIILV